MMKRRMERMQALGMIAKVPAMLVFECKVVLKAYYGSYCRAALVMLWEWFYLSALEWYWRFVYWLCDKIGWTKLRPIPGTRHFERHGGKCQYLNCGDMDCIQKSVPQWFQKLTRMDR